MKRRAYLAGQWYPGDAKSCEQEIVSYTRDIIANSDQQCGLIGPHAGWRFSGACAARAYKSASQNAQDIDLVVIFGSHKSGREQHSIFLGDSWETPLGDLDIASDLTNAISKNEDFMAEPVAPNFIDNAVEVHLPFVKHFFPKAQLLMLGISPTKDALRLGEKVGAFLNEKNVKAFFVGSTDLTHYGPNYRFSPKGAGPQAVEWVRQENDLGFIEALLAKQTAQAIEHALEHQSACCPGAAAATMEAVKAYRGSLKPELGEHLLSYDILPSDSFVGYASIIL